MGAVGSQGLRLVAGVQLLPQHGYQGQTLSIPLDQGGQCS